MRPSCPTHGPMRYIDADSGGEMWECGRCRMRANVGGRSEHERWRLEQGVSS